MYNGAALKYYLSDHVVFLPKWKKSTPTEKKLWKIKSLRNTQFFRQRLKMQYSRGQPYSPQRLLPLISFSPSHRWVAPSRIRKKILATGPTTARKHAYKRAQIV